MRSTWRHIKSGREEEWGGEFDGVWVSFLNLSLQSNKQDLSKIAAGKITLNPKGLDLHSFLDIKFCQIFIDLSESMVELVKQGKQKEAREVFSTKKGALIVNEY
ncbi:hypothetical protein QUA82_21550 [Microcoleus sp. F8-D3]